jgi:formate dehydrogenase iron-sulfur subunit
MAKKAKLIDVSRCTACRGCQAACKNWNQLPAVETQFTGSYENPPEFQPTTWTRVTFNEDSSNGQVKWHFAKKQCMHCTDAACLSICPAQAIYHTPLGTVRIDQEKCVGCGACVGVCPFGVPRVDPNTKKSRKCTMCYERLTNDKKPACVTACPTGALSFGDRDEMIALGEERVDALKEKGYANAQLYGVDELGGLGVIYVLTESPAAYNFPEDPAISEVTMYLWKMALGPIRTLATVGLAAGALSGWLQMRKEEIRKEKEEIK